MNILESYSESLKKYGPDDLRSVHWGSLESQQERFTALLGIADDLIHNTFLEYGCGLGDLSRRVGPQSYYGYDINPDMIAAAKLKYHDIAGRFSSNGVFNVYHHRNSIFEIEDRECDRCKTECSATTPRKDYLVDENGGCPNCGCITISPKRLRNPDIFDYVLISSVFNDVLDGDSEERKKYLARLKYPGDRLEDKAYLAKKTYELTKAVHDLWPLCRKGLAVNGLSLYCPEPSGDNQHFDPFDIAKYFAASLTHKLTLRHDYRIGNFTIYLYK